MKEIIVITKIYFILILITAANVGIKAQSDNLQYFTVSSKDSVYIFLSNQHLLLLSSQEYSGEFNYLSTIEGSFTAQTKFNFTDQHLLVLNSDTLHLYDISDPFTPVLLSSKKFDFTVGEIHNFNPYFVLITQNIAKLVNPMLGEITVIEDTLITHSNNFYYYPYIFTSNIFYKYVENFGVFEVFVMNDYPRWRYLAGDRLYYHCVIYSFPSSPPSVCNLRARKFEEPNFSLILDLNYWADCTLPLIASFKSGSARFIYMTNSQDGHFVLNMVGIIVFTHTDLTYSLHLSDNYLFKLGSNILYSKYLSPSIFNELNYIVSVDETSQSVQNYLLTQNYPNPFNSSTKISWQTPVHSHQTLKVYDMLGREVAKLVDEERSAGKYEVTFNATKLVSGVYFYTLQINDFIQTKKMALLR